MATRELPRWLQPLLHAALMRATDEWAIETKKAAARPQMPESSPRSGSARGGPPAPDA